MKEVEISVIIPTYNRRQVLEETLKRISRQTFSKEKFEIIVIDDCSTDKTQDFLKKYKSVTRFCYLLNPSNLGRASTRNRGIRKADGKLILMLDDDIWADETLIEAHYKEHLRRGQESAVVGAIRVAKEVPRTVVNEYLSMHHNWCFAEMCKHGERLPFEFCKTANLSLRRETLLRVGLFDENYVKYGAEDTELGHRLLKSGVDLCFARGAVAFHYHDETLSSFAIRSANLGESYVRLIQQHPDAASGDYDSFFVPRFHKKLTWRAILYNLVKLLVFNGIARQINKMLIKTVSLKKGKIAVRYLLPLLSMQYKYYGMKGVDI